MTAGREGGSGSSFPPLWRRGRVTVKAQIQQMRSGGDEGVGVGVGVKDSITVQDKLAKEFFKTLTFDF